MKVRIAIAVGCATILAGTAFGQAGTYRTNYQAPYASGAFTGQPYSAEQVYESKQTLADGTNISRPASTSKMYRDAAGRMRSERAIMIGYPPREDGPSIVEIYDVVAGYRYILDPVNKVAHRSAIPAPPQRPGGVGGFVGSPRAISTASTAPAVGASPVAPKAADSTPRPETTSESLGTQVIEGLTCQGTKMTTTYPTGMIGNDRPLTSTSENWTSNELRLMVLSKRKDPRMGETTVTLKNISRADPEYSLFQPPPDYKIVDETGSFEVVIKLP